jgi:hypothetical protein
MIRLMHNIPFCIQIQGIFRRKDFRVPPYGRAVPHNYTDPFLPKLSGIVNLDFFMGVGNE